ncbi:polysaccharide deacetylase family protein [Aequorivita capsosiphonis]|uniref:polysaccharide deacetylase family protein n=1 Tax=Aequorivita capsosiphonis TaxID=487317 RepID=UPI000554735C|nr:polysaccharide deacetylase family protein [Aequorivita capsosiphonis]
MPRFIQRLYPERIWAFSRKKKSIYLTFDDGPIPVVTPWVLEELKKHNAKATFFCIGNNILKHPDVFQQILSEGHSVGNHTFNHLNGWKTETSVYVENAEKAARQMMDAGYRVTDAGRRVTEDYFQKKKESEIGTQQSLFRPPYGRISSKQAKLLQKKGFKIVMWDIVSYDYDTRVSKEECLQNVMKNIKPGSVIVFHDSLRAEKNLRYVLPKVLKFISEKEWKYLCI